MGHMLKSRLDENYFQIHNIKDGYLFTVSHIVLENMKIVIQLRFEQKTIELNI